ncbi:MAG: hypothetical protein KBT27_13075 [Prevotellaceae bacterium]|nr:hypothetical protein [Candidatus Faecinaster equi]
MLHNIKLNSVDLMLIVDALDVIESEVNNAKAIRKQIINEVLKDFKERENNDGN